VSNSSRNRQAAIHPAIELTVLKISPVRLPGLRSPSTAWHARCAATIASAALPHTGAVTPGTAPTTAVCAAVAIYPSTWAPHSTFTRSPAPNLELPSPASSSGELLATQLFLLMLVGMEMPPSTAPASSRICRSILVAQGCNRCSGRQAGDGPRHCPIHYLCCASVLGHNARILREIILIAKPPDQLCNHPCHRRENAHPYAHGLYLPKALEQLDFP